MTMAVGVILAPCSKPAISPNMHADPQSDCIACMDFAGAYVYGELGTSAAMLVGPSMPPADP